MFIVRACVARADDPYLPHQQIVMAEEESGSFCSGTAEESYRVGLIKAKSQPLAEDGVFISIFTNGSVRYPNKYSKLPTANCSSGTLNHTPRTHPIPNNLIVNWKFLLNFMATVENAHGRNSDNR